MKIVFQKLFETWVKDTKLSYQTSFALHRQIFVLNTLQKQLNFSSLTLHLLINEFPLLQVIIALKKNNIILILKSKNIMLQ